MDFIWFIPLGVLVILGIIGFVVITWIDKLEKY